MNETIVLKFAALSFFEILILLGFAVFCVICLMIGFVSAIDRLNIKSFSLRNGVTFYQEGETMTGRLSGKKKIVRRKTK